MMSGMLVPVQPVDKAAQAIQTLFGVDPEFVTLCKVLYGPDVDPVEVWTDVFGKDEPTGSDSYVPGDLNSRRGRKRATAAAALVSTGAGGLVAGQKLVSSAGRGKIVPAIALGGDALATGELAQHFRTLGGGKRTKNQNTVVTGTKAARDDSVEKFSVGALADGFEAGMRKLPGLGGLAPKVKTAASQAKLGATGARNRAAGKFAAPTLPYKAGATVKPLVSTPGRRMATGAGTAALVGAGTAHQMNKRDESEDLDVVWAGEFEKFDEDKRLVFGWASVVEVNGVPVVDKQGDYIHPDDLETASYEYVIKSRVGGDMHSRDGDIPLKVSDLVESMVVTPEKLEKMGVPAHVAKNMPTGWWVGFKVHSDKHWDLVKKRARGGFSIHGRGKRVPMSIDSLMPGYH